MTMTFDLRPQWCLVIALLLSGTPAQCDNKITTHSQAERTKRDALSLYGNNFNGQSRDGASYLQTDNQNVWPYSKQSSDRYGPLFHQMRELDTQNYLLDPMQTRSNVRYFHNFVGKRDPEIDTDTYDRLELDDLENSDNDDVDSIDLMRRRAPQFSHSFIGKRTHPSTDNSNLWKRMPVQLFARRAPHYSHSFVGKRSADGDDYDSNDIFSTIPDGAVNFLNLKSQPSFHFTEIPPVHNVVKRAINVEKRGPAFGHSFVGKRLPGFGHSFVGKRVPGFGHSFVGKRGPRFGHSFVGKREDDSVEDIETQLAKDEDEEDLESTFTPEEVPEQTEFGLDQDLSVDSVESPDKRQQRPSQNPLNSLGKRPSFSHSFVGKRAPGFGHSFVGKRAPGFGHNFVGKRVPGFGHSFVGKRPSFGHSFVGKRGPRFGHSFVGKRGPSFGHSFVGKRGPSFGHSFVGKRGPGFGHSFVGKRPGFSHSFVGKREGDFDDIISEKQEDSAELIENESEEDFTDVAFPEELTIVEETSNDSTSPQEIIDKNNSDLFRNMSPDASESPDKRQPSYSHAFIGKRVPGFGHSFVGKRAPRFGHSFVGKRYPGFGHSFVGKRAPRFGHSFVGKRAPSFGHSFVGKRAPRFGHSFVGKRAPRFGHSFVGKRAPGFGHSFVGKRMDEETVTEDDLLEDSLKQEDVNELVEFIEAEESANNKEADSNAGVNSSKS